MKEKINFKLSKDLAIAESAIEICRHFVAHRGQLFPDSLMSSISSNRTYRRMAREKEREWDGRVFSCTGSEERGAYKQEGTRNFVESRALLVRSLIYGGSS